MNKVEKIRDGLNRVKINLYLSDRELESMEKFRKLKEDYLTENGYMKEGDQYDYSDLVFYILGNVLEAKPVNLGKGW